MEVETGANEGRGGVGEARRIRVTRWRLSWVGAYGVERRLDAKPAFAATAFSCGFFGGGERVAACGNGIKVKVWGIGVKGKVVELVEEREGESLVVTIATAEEEAEEGHFGKMCLKP